jgi:hypothetical protein
MSAARRIWDISLIDARTLPPEQVRAYKARGLDLDRGMVLDQGGTVYYAEGALLKIVTAGKATWYASLLNRIYNRSPGVAKAIYSILVFSRRILLTLMFKRRI